MAAFTAPYTDVRVERPYHWSWIEALPGLVAVNLNPPAAGPEAELVFGTAVGVEPADEEFVKAEVSRMGLRVLASRRRDLALDVPPLVPELALRLADVSSVIDSAIPRDADGDPDPDYMEAMEAQLGGGFFSALDHALRGDPGCLDPAELELRRRAALAKFGPELGLEAVQIGATNLAGVIREVAIPSLRYCEEKYGHDDQARLNLEAAIGPS